MSYIKNHHATLRKEVSHKLATDAEVDDFHQNEKYEDSFFISGCPRIPGEIVGKAWQDQAVKDVKAVLYTLMGRDYTLVFVQNATSRVPNSEVKYNVQMADVKECRSLSFLIWV